VEILHKGMRGKSGKVTITVPMAGTHSEGNGTTFTLPEGVTVAETIHYFIEAANGAAIAPGTGAIMTDGTSPAIAGPWVMEVKAVKGTGTIATKVLNGTLTGNGGPGDETTISLFDGTNGTVNPAIVRIVKSDNKQLTDTFNGTVGYVDKANNPITVTVIKPEENILCLDVADNF
jgi:hypothetical protein